MKPIIEAKKIKVVTYYAYEIYIGGNPDRFKQLMVNLIENAVKYSYDGGTVTSTAKRKKERYLSALMTKESGSPRKTFQGFLNGFTGR